MSEKLHSKWVIAKFDFLNELGPGLRRALLVFRPWQFEENVTLAAKPLKICDERHG
jgi:hypothetical protein